MGERLFVCPHRIVTSGTYSCVALPLRFRYARML